MLKGTLTSQPYNKKISKKIEEALQFLHSIDCKTVPLGRIEISSEMFAQVLEYETKAYAEYNFETHHRFFDIHYLVSGEEKIYYTNEKLTETIPYDPKRDIVYYEETENYRYEVLQQGQYMFIEPAELHKTHCHVANQPSKVRKIVVKILLEEE